MIQRPSLRATVTTVAAAALLVGGASLASYATTSHGHGSGGGHSTAAPKTIKYTLGSPGQVFKGNTDHLFTAKVPKGTYQVGMSGLILDQTSATDDSYTCVIADQQNIVHVLGGGAPNYARWYALDGDSKGDFKYGVVNISNNAQHIGRTKIVFGCLFSGSGTFTMGRPVTFTLLPVKSTAAKGTPLPVAKAQVRHLVGKLN